MTKEIIEKRIKETESNIKNWYTQPGETEKESNYYLRMEKKYLAFLKNKVTGISYLGMKSKSRIDDIMSRVECF